MFSALSYLPLGFAFLLPLSQKLSTICLGIWAFVSLIFLKKDSISKNKVYIVPVLYYIFLGISLFYSKTLELHHLEHKLSFLILPLIFFLNTGGTLYTSKKVMHFFVYGCIAAIIVSLVNATYNSMDIHSGSIIFEPRISPNFSLYNSIIYGGNYFFGTNFSILHQTVYFSMYLTMALLVIIEFPYKKRYLNWIFAGMILITICMVMNRASYLVLFTIGLLYTLFKLKKPIHRALLICFVCIGVLLVAKLDPRINRTITNLKVFLNSDTTADTSELINNIDRRILLWKESFHIARENPVFGVGIGDVTTTLNERFQRKGVNNLSNLNAHDQYLQTIMEFGILGIILLFALFFYIVKYMPATYSKSFTYGFLILLMVNFIFESMFNRYSGLSFVIFFYCLLLRKANRETPIVPKEVGFQ